MDDPTTPGHPLRLRVELAADAAHALIRLAAREDRTTDRQAARLIVEGLRRLGEIPEETERREVPA